MVCIKREESPRFGATCILAEIVTMAYLFAVLILSFFLTGDFFLPNTSGEERIVIGVIGCFLPWPVIYLYYSKKRIKALLEKYQDNVYNTKYSDKTVLSVRYVVPTIGLLIFGQDRIKCQICCTDYWASFNALSLSVLNIEQVVKYQ